MSDHQDPSITVKQASDFMVWFNDQFVKTSSEVASLLKTDTTRENYRHQAATQGRFVFLTWVNNEFVVGRQKNELAAVLDALPLAAAKGFFESVHRTVHNAVDGQDEQTALARMLAVPWAVEGMLDAYIEFRDRAEHIAGQRRDY